LVIDSLPDKFGQVLAADPNIIVLHGAGDIQQAPAVSGDQSCGPRLPDIIGFILNHGSGDGRLFDCKCPAKAAAIGFMLQFNQINIFQLSNQ
jgi:hypothetical protein